jgi:hypothetical protein
METNRRTAVEHSNSVAVRLLCTTLAAPPDYGSLNSRDRLGNSFFTYLMDRAGKKVPRLHLYNCLLVVDCPGKAGCHWQRAGESACADCVMLVDWWRRTWRRLASSASKISRRHDEAAA